MEKRKHKFNIVDVIVIVLLAAGVAALVYHFAKGGAPDKTVSLTYVMQTDMVPEELSDNVAVGDAVYDGATGRKIGEVAACDSRPAQHTGTAANGSQVVSEVAGYRSLYVTCEATCPAGGDGFSVDGVAISSGCRYTLMFPSLYCEAECVSVGTTIEEE